MRLLPLLTVLVLALGLVACDSVVDDIEEPIASAGDADLTSPDQADFLINGIISRSNNVQDNITVQSSLLSDQFIFGGDIGGGATFPTFRSLMVGLTDVNPFTNNSIDGTQNNLGQYRFLADNLLRRAETLGADAFGGTDSDGWQRVQFNGNFHGGLARYYWATYFGGEPRTGGGVISDLENPADPERGDFIPSSEMYDLAIDKLDAAAPFAATGYEQRVINSVKARIALFRNDAASAASLAASGLTAEDAPFQNQYIERAGGQNNAWFAQGGPGRTQAAAALRFYYGEDYLNQDLENPEAARIPQFDAEDTGVIEASTPFNILDLDNRSSQSPVRFDLGLEPGDAVNLFAQARYMERSDNIDFITWQEMNLIRAEAAERGETSDDPVVLINEVRDSHGLDPIDPADYDGMNTIFLERDKEMFSTGIRLPDQRRATDFGLDSFGLDLDLHGWHLGPEAWWYLAITNAERNNNPNDLP